MLLSLDKARGHRHWIRVDSWTNGWQQGRMFSGELRATCRRATDCRRTSDAAAAGWWWLRSRTVSWSCHSVACLSPECVWISFLIYADTLSQISEKFIHVCVFCGAKKSRPIAVNVHLGCIRMCVWLVKYAFLIHSRPRQPCFLSFSSLPHDVCWAVCVRFLLDHWPHCTSRPQRLAASLSG